VCSDKAGEVTFLWMDGESSARSLKRNRNLFLSKEWQGQVEELLLVTLCQLGCYDIFSL
jgi:hypothetical protein